MHGFHNLRVVSAHEHNESVGTGVTMARLLTEARRDPWLTSVWTARWTGRRDAGYLGQGQDEECVSR